MAAIDVSSIRKVPRADDRLRLDRSPASVIFAVPLLAGLLGAPTAEAQNLNNLLDLPFEDLLAVEIRSAGKREEQIRDIPASVTIITRNEIARFGWPTLEALLRNVPGFYLLDNTEERFIGTRGAVGGGVQFLVNGIAQHPSVQKGLTVPEIARLNIPVESIDRIEIIRGPMSVIYGNNAFLGVVNIVTNDIGANGPRVSASAGNRGTGALFARLGGADRDGSVVLNAGARRDDGLAGAYADMLSPAQLARLDPAMHRDMDGDMPQEEYSLDLSAAWQDLSADFRWTRRDYGIYALTPAFDDGTRIRLDTLHLSLAWTHRFNDDLGLRVTGTRSQERYEGYEADFLAPDLDGGQAQRSRRWELEADLHWQPGDQLDALLGYRLLHIDDVLNRIEPVRIGRTILPIEQTDATTRLNDYTIHDLFGELGWQLHEALRLLAGARLTVLPDDYRIERTERRTGETSDIILDPGDRYQLNGRVAVLWSPTPQQVVKLIWGTASQEAGELDVAEPEHIQTLELNTALTRPGLMLSASLFENRIDSIARTIQRLDTRTGDYVSVDDSSGRWRTRGLELILDARPLPALGLSASLTWQQTEDERSQLDPGYSPALLAKFRTEWRQGPMTYAAYAHYTDGMDADWDFVTGPVQGVARRIGKPVPGYWNLGLNLRWDPEGDGPYANLNLSNLLDTEIRYPANELTDFERGQIGPRRIMTATFGWEF